jgi:tRNA-modifying protein YgfZ
VADTGMTDSPLLGWPGAVPASWPDEGVAAHYGDPVKEQRAFDAGTGFTDRSSRGVVTVTGPDRLTWLHSLTSQKLDQLAPGEAAQALILDPNGHVEHHLTLTDDGTTTWIHTEPGAAAALAQFLDSMRFMLRVEVTDATGQYAVLSVHGPDLIAGLDGVTVTSTTASYEINDLIVERDRLAGTADELAGRGGTAAGMWAFEALRIAARVPRLGVDTDHRTIPHEVGWIETAVHLNKGCYRGQETVARVHNLGHPPRRLVFLDLDGSVDRLPAHGDPVELDGEQVGFTGSAARHYELGPIGLALIKRTVPADATLLAGGVAAAQEIIVSPDAGANVKVTLKRRTIGLGRPLPGRLLRVAPRTARRVGQPPAAPAHRDRTADAGDRRLLRGGGDRRRRRPGDPGAALVRAAGHARLPR